MNTGISFSPFKTKIKLNLPIHLKVWNRPPQDVDVLAVLVPVFILVLDRPKSQKICSPQTFSPRPIPCSGPQRRRRRGRLHLGTSRPAESWSEKERIKMLSQKAVEKNGWEIIGPTEDKTYNSQLILKPCSIF